MRNTNDDQILEHLDVDAMKKQANFRICGPSYHRQMYNSEKAINKSKQTL